MKSKFTWIFTLLLAFFIQFSFAQERTITGVVTGSDNLPIPSVTVMVEGVPASAVQTDFDGRYSISASTGQRLVFSFVGMETQTVTVGASNTVSVKMNDVREIEEVVVEGYRTTSRRTSAVAVTTITSETIEGRPNVSFVQSLQGQIPGLNISTGSGQPGSSNTTVILRGVGSINGNIEPLYVIDGVPTNFSNFRSLNANDIASVSVLKDAGATSIYGNRGANGVIVVTTKRGRFDSKLNIRYSSVTGFTTLQDHDYRQMNSRQLLRLEKQKGVGLGVALTDEEINNFHVDTNWQDVFFRTGLSQDHNISFTQGSKNTNSFISIGYFDQEGIVPDTDLKRISVRSNFSGKSENDRFNYALNIYGAYSRRNQLETETRTDIDGNVLQNPLQGSLSSLPYLDPATYVNGQQLFDEFGSPSFGITPFMLMDYLNTIHNEYDEIKLLFNGSAGYKITDELTLSANAGVDYTQNSRVFARPPQSYLAIISANSVGQPIPGLAQESWSGDMSFNANTRLNYNKTFAEKHNIDVSVFTEYFKAHSKSTAYSTNGLDFRTFSPGAGTGYIPFNPATPTFFNRTVGSTKAEAGLFSYFGQIDYDYDGKFGFQVTGRRDASYRFTADNKWGSFWSVSGRWNLDRMSFLENNSIITELKLRASIGTAGNQNIAGESPYAAANLTRTLYGTASGYGNASALGLAQIGNIDLRWETIRQTNVGLDFVLAKRLRGTLDVYRKKTIDLYLELPQSAITGLDEIDANNGDLVNDGVELLLGYDVFKASSSDDFALTINGNASYNDNKFKYLPNGDVALGTLQIYAEGGPAYQYYTVRYAGVNPANGNALFYDRNGAITENPTLDDRVMTNKSPIPRYQGGFGFEASYKGFYLTTQFTFVSDVYRFDSDLQSLSDSNSIGNFPVTTDLERAWTPDNRVTDIPSINSTNTAAEDLSDRFLRDSSYLRLKFSSVGYNVPSKFLEQTFLSSLRVYAQAENLLTWTKWRGFDAESNGASTFGGYPTPRIVSFGLDLTF
jgi:TonB-linked SusC/RagA family outer membrane protein